MNVLMLNGSPHQPGAVYLAPGSEVPRKAGCTFTALCEVAKPLIAAGMDVEIFPASDPSPEKVKQAAEYMKKADALVIGSPVYWASPTGEMILFMDRFVALAGNAMRHKPAAAVASARRAGTTATLDVLLKYLTFHEMPVVSSFYWPMVHGNTPEEVQKDEEGLQIMRRLGGNMLWLLQCIEAGKEKGVKLPDDEPKCLRTNFIR